MTEWCGKKLDGRSYEHVLWLMSSTEEEVVEIVVREPWSVGVACRGRAGDEEGRAGDEGGRAGNEEWRAGDEEGRAGDEEGRARMRNGGLGMWEGWG